jgi:hypothetical protein
MVHTSRINALRTRYGEPFFILCVCVVFTTAYALWVGQDASWDQKNYYFYSVYAWLRGRTFSDVAPGQITTWLNPLPYLLQYLLIQSVPPVVAGLLMGALAGLNGLMLWLLARRLQRGDPTWQGRVCACVIILVGLTGSIFLSEVGTTFAQQRVGAGRPHFDHATPVGDGRQAQRTELPFGWALDGHRMWSQIDELYIRDRTWRIFTCTMAGGRAAQPYDLVLYDRRDLRLSRNRRVLGRASLAGLWQSYGSVL